jgi:hypothetical protein
MHVAKTDVYACGLSLARVRALWPCPSFPLFPSCTQVRALYLAHKLMLHLAGIIAERSGTVILPADMSSGSRTGVSKAGRRNHALRFA